MQNFRAQKQPPPITNFWLRVCLRDVSTETLSIIINLIQIEYMFKFDFE